MNFIEDAILMGKAPIAGLITLVGSWFSVIAGSWLAQVSPDPTSSLIEFIVTKNSSTLGVTAVLALAIWWLGKDRDKTQERHDQEKADMKKDYEARISKTERELEESRAEIRELQKYVFKRKAGVSPSDITTKRTDLELGSNG